MKHTLNFQKMKINKKKEIRKKWLEHTIIQVREREEKKAAWWS